MTPKRVQMTKVRDMASIRPLKKVAPVQKTHITPAKNTTPAQLQPHISKLQQEAAQFREVVMMAIEDLAHPVTVAEVQKHVGMELNKEFNQPRIRFAFDALLADGRLLARLETDDERRLRFDGARPIAGKAILYYPASLADHVPERTKVEVVAGTKLTGRGDWSTGSKKRKPAIRKPDVAASGAKPNTGSLTGMPSLDAMEMLIEKIVEARHADLIKELNETKAQLEKVKSILS